MLLLLLLLVLELLCLCPCLQSEMRRLRPFVRLDPRHRQSL